MSNAWARFVSRTWLAWLMVWPVVAIPIFLSAPRIPTLLRDSSRGFLPDQFPSHRALVRLREEFPHRYAASRAVLLLLRPSGLTPHDREFISSITSRLMELQPELQWNVTSPASSPFLKPLLESRDGQAAIIAIDPPSDMLTQHSVNRVRRIQRLLAENPPPAGLDVLLTGSAALGALIEAGTKRDIDLTTIWALLAVALILLFVYRSPLAMLLPLVTIGLALAFILGTLGWAATIGWPINGLVQMFIIVMVLGCGVDYCMVLFARFHEEVQARTSPAPSRSSADVQPRECVILALTHAAPAIVAGAATVSLGLLTLGLARNRDYYTSGPTIAIAIIIATFAVLSLTPSVMIWLARPLAPRRTRPAESPAWRWAATVVLQRPLAVAGISLALLMPPALLAARIQPLYDDLSEFPGDADFVRGARAFYHHFFNDRPTSELTLLVTCDAPLPAESPVLSQALDAIHSHITRALPVAYYRDFNDPLGAGDRAAPRPALVHAAARAAYIGQSNKTFRIDIGLFAEPRSQSGMALVEKLRSVAVQSIAASGLLQKIQATQTQVDISGESAFYADQKILREQDIRLITVVAIAVILIVLYFLVRSVSQAIILVAATLLTYYATCGAAYLIVHHAFGLEGLNWKLNFLLFVIILSLGQDYNIFVVARIAEEMRAHPPQEAIARAIQKTGRVVSSCGLIMAATFASMFAGSLMLLKEFAIALTLGILLDTFVVRPLLVPSLILLLGAWNRQLASRTAPQDSTSGPLAVH